MPDGAVGRNHSAPFYTCVHVAEHGGTWTSWTTRNRPNLRFLGPMRAGRHRDCQSKCCIGKGGGGVKFLIFGGSASLTAFPSFVTVPA